MSPTMHYRMGVITLILWWKSTLHSVITAESKSTSVSEAFSHFDTATTSYSSDNYLKCIFDHHIIPTSTEEVTKLVQILHSATPPVKIRATRRGFHSSAGFVCPGPRASTKKEFHGNLDDGSLPPSITILLHRLNNVIQVDANRHMLTVGAGMTQFDLLDAAELHNMSIRAGALSIYGNLTVSGVILTSAHGSGLGTISSLGDLVTKVKWVNGKGEIFVSDTATEPGAEEVKALVGGLGLLGIVTEFTLQLEPRSRTVVKTRNNLDDINIVADVTKMLEEETPHVIVHWRPDDAKYRAVMWRRQQQQQQVMDDEESALPNRNPEFYPNGKIVYFNAVEKEVVESWGEHLAAWEADLMEESENADDLNAKTCAMGEAMLNVPFFRDKDGTVLEHATIPTNNAMLSAECSPKCFYQVKHMGTITEDIEFTIKVSQLDDWVKDVKKIVTAELAEPQACLERKYGKHRKNIKRCLPPGYFWLRFGRGNQNLLSTNTGTEDVAYVQWISLVSIFNPNKHTKQSSLTETIEQLSLCKYKARPHWGKNHERTFRHPKCHVRDNFPATNIAKLLNLQRRHDPLKHFEPELFSHLRRRSGPEYSNHCSLHFWCYCELDAHCARGRACQPSPVFPEYKTCRVVEPSAPQHDEL